MPLLFVKWHLCDMSIGTNKTGHRHSILYGLFVYAMDKMKMFQTIKKLDLYFN